MSVLKNFHTYVFPLMIMDKKEGFFTRLQLQKLFSGPILGLRDWHFAYGNSQISA